VGITVLKNNVPWGPFTRAQIDEGLQRGDFTLQTLAHAPGIDKWLPLEEVIHTLQPKLPPVPATRDLPPVPMPSMEALAASKPLLAPALPKIEPIVPKGPPLLEKPEVTLNPAPFFSRAMAFVIDCSILFLPLLLIMGVGVMVTALRGWWEGTDPETMHQQWALLSRNFHELLWLIAIGLAWFYAAGLECSTWQATIGKRWAGIKVTDANGQRLGFLQATGRHFGKYLSAIPCFLGFMVALFSSRGMTWHDRLADTRVVRD
jgi:uncharacterized RDD family membrane protein YckC